jgi:hypothetical protein
MITETEVKQKRAAAPATSAAKRTRAQKKQRKWRILLIVVASLFIIRLILPYFVLRYVNNKLESLNEYTGHVEDIDLALIRGAYQIHNINIEKKQKQKKGETIPFFSAPEIDLSVEWRALFKGSIVGEIAFEQPVLNFVFEKEAARDKDLKGDTADFRTLLKDLMPLKVNHFEVHDGQIHYIDNTRKPNIDVAMTDVQVSGNNLSNVNDSAKLLPASVEATGQAYDGEFKFNMNLDALNKTPTFDMNAELKNLNLTKINDFLKAYGNFDVSKGRFGLYTEFAAKNGGFGGYVKPIIKDIDVLTWNKEEGNIGQKLWEGLVGAAAEILKNRTEEQVATKVPIKGRFDSPDINTWRAVSMLLKNAFVAALKPAIDNSINIHKLEDEKKKTLLEQLFNDGKKEGAEMSKKEKRKQRRKERREKRKSN